MESKKVFYFGDFLINEQTTLELADGSSATELSTKGSKGEDDQSEETEDKEGGDEYRVGDTVIHLRNGFKLGDYDESKEPEDQKKIVGIKKIEKIEGDKYYFKNKEGEEFFKYKKDIIKKIEKVEESLSNEFEIIKFSNFK